MAKDLAVRAHQLFRAVARTTPAPLSWSSENELRHLAYRFPFSGLISTHERSSDGSNSASATINELVRTSIFIFCLLPSQPCPQLEIESALTADDGASRLTYIPVRIGSCPFFLQSLADPLGRLMAGMATGLMQELRRATPQSYTFPRSHTCGSARKHGHFSYCLAHPSATSPSPDQYRS